jgi:hypothetical protein
MLLASFLSVSGYAADQDRQTLEGLISDLEKKIEDADKRMIAHPKFLDELRVLVNQYRSRLRLVYLSEDFNDGEYRNNPTWVVASGKFQVTGSHRLLSEVSAEQPKTPPPSSSEKSTPLGIFMKDILKTTTEEEKGGGETPSVSLEARIQTLAKIGPEFEVDLTFLSRSSRGSMEVLLLGGTQNTPLYRMVYRAGASSERPIEIIREREGKSYLIETATQYPSLDDGILHRLQWMRDSQGRMRVVVDGKEVLSTYEIYYRSNFSGLALVNKGGTYEWGPISVFKAIETKTQ